MDKEQTFEIQEENQNENVDVSENINIMTTMPPHNNPPQPLPYNPLKKDYSPGKWEDSFDELYYLNDGTSVFTAGNEGALYFCMHGAGHSALSFAKLAQEVKKFGTLVAYDLKGHGFSKNNQNLSDFSISTLCNEAIYVLKQVMAKYSNKNVITIGHSLGGSICARITDMLTNQQKNEKICGCIIIDVVQGTAIEALPFMTQILNDRPKSFDSLQNAIKWSIKSGTLKKVESAKISIPPQLVQKNINGLIHYVWKVNLKQTQKYWIQWFKDLTQTFLRIHIPKILVTAQKQRMDKQLTIAQMQGKFKLSILYNVGHSIQQDDYKGFAQMTHQFVKNFRIPMTQDEVKRRKQEGIANFHPNIKQYHPHPHH